MACCLRRGKPVPSAAMTGRTDGAAATPRRLEQQSGRGRNLFLRPGRRNIGLASGIYRRLRRIIWSINKKLAKASFFSCANAMLQSIDLLIFCKESIA